MARVGNTQRNDAWEKLQTISFCDSAAKCQGFFDRVLQQIVVCFVVDVAKVNTGNEYTRRHGEIHEDRLSNSSGG